jgi:CheY-like chemotaxis protein/anti-sigma regulatory factor (Ser/Thr protein kinase)
METILVVDDETDVRQNISDLLENSGYKTVQASEGSEALSVIGNITPDLIISDIKMQKMNGYELLDKLQAHCCLRNIPFIFLTAKSEDHSFRKGMNLGADDYITKPYDARDLLKAVEIRLNKKKKAGCIIDEIVKNILMYVPHELRTPLVSISGFSQLIAENYYSLSADEIYEMVSRIRASNIRLQKTVNKFITLSEMICSSDSLKRNSELTNARLSSPESVIRSTALNKASEFDRTGDLIFDLSGSDVFITEEHLQLIVSEIVENSMKFSFPGTPIEIKSGTYRDSYILSIKDYGKGMTQEQLLSINAFMQFGREYNQQQGNGLGLIITKKAAELFSGSLNIESEAAGYLNVKIGLKTI